MTPYYLGGYYLMKIRPIGFGSLKSKTVCTCSNCINDNLVENWSYSWTNRNDSQIDRIKQDYQIDDDAVPEIRDWVDKAFNEKRIGWINVFDEPETAKEYERQFFSHLPDTRLIGIYFNQTEADALLREFIPQGENIGDLGLYDNLNKRLPEKESSNEIFIGYDIVGIEVDGNFHTFYCHDIANGLTEKFDLTINEYGLFEEADDWQPVLDFMNDEQNGFEPVPWFVCKNKLVKD